MDAFCRRFPTVRKLFIGAQGLPVDEFLKMDSLPVS
jgi:hypothetical protein